MGTYQPKTFRKDGGDTFEVDYGGKIAFGVAESEFITVEVKSTGRVVFDQVRATNGALEFGNILAYTSADYGFNLGTRKTVGGVSTRQTRGVAVCCNDGGLDPADRIEASCHMFTQLVDWATGWSATALEGVFYGGYDLIATEDNMNISGAGGWIYLNDEAGGAAAPVVGAASGKLVYVCGLESWVALPADVDIKATGKICGLKLSNNFASGMTAGTGHTYNIYTETVDSVGYEYFWGTNCVGNGLSENVAICAVNTAYALAIDVNGTPGYIPVFTDKSWGS